MSSPRVLVVQNGSRHNYAVPTVLERAGMLEALYTDACGDVGIGKLLSIGRRLPVVGKRLQRLHERHVPSGVAEKTTSFAVAHALDQALPLSVGGIPHFWAARQMIRHGYRDATMIYSSLGWGRAFLEQARERGIMVVTEFYVRPSIWRTYQAEYRAFPSWEAELPWGGLENAIGTRLDPCTVSDYVIVPAEGACDDVAREHKFPKERILVIPYGVEHSWFQIHNTPVPGRVLFVASCSLGKGIHYYAMAAERLKQKSAFSTYEFRAAGNVTERVRAQPACRHLHFLGRIPRTEIWREYQSADLLVFPTLSDSFGMVILEAMAAGVPVVCSPYCADVVEHGRNGFVTEPRNVSELGSRIAEIVEDRTKRDQMAAAARERAMDFTREKYGHRLVAALRSLSEAKGER